MWGRTSRCGAARTSTGAPRETLTLPSGAIDHRRGRAGLQLLGTSRRRARVAVPQPGGRMPLDLRFSFRPARPYLPCAPRSAQKLKTRRQYASDSSTRCLPRPVVGASRGNRRLLPLVRRRGGLSSPTPFCDMGRLWGGVSLGELLCIAEQLLAPCCGLDDLHVSRGCKYLVEQPGSSAYAHRDA